MLAFSLAFRKVAADGSSILLFVFAEEGRTSHIHSANPEASFMKSAMRVCDAMTAPNLVTVRTDCTVRDLRALFGRYDIDVVPVVARDAEGGMRKLSGVVTRADLLQFLVPAKSVKSLDRKHRETVAAIARWLAPLAPDASLGAAATRLVDEKIEALPVADPAGRVIGMLSLSDVLDSSTYAMAVAR